MLRLCKNELDNKCISNMYNCAPPCPVSSLPLTSQRSVDGKDDKHDNDNNLYHADMEHWVLNRHSGHAWLGK